MQIGSLSTSASLAHITPVNRPQAAASPAPDAPKAGAASTSSTAPTPSSSKAAPAKESGHASSSSTSSSAASAESIAALYTASVNGKTYSGDVTYSGGQYVVSLAPSIPGVSATGSSVQAAEDSLGSILSEVV